MNKIVEKKYNLSWSIILPLIGMAFLIYYIFVSSCDIPTTDYIRVINNYIEDPFNINKILIPDFIVRCPITYLMRAINVAVFKYSIYFDRIISIIFLAIFSGITIYHTRTKINNNLVKNISSVVIFIICFSLNSWEMILNGTGYPIFIFFALVSLIYYLFDAYILTSSADKKIYAILIILFFTCILTAGDYLVALNTNLIIVSIIYIIFNHKKKDKNIDSSLIFLIVLSITLIIIYYISGHSGESKDYVYDEMKDISLMTLVFTDPIYILKFIIKTFAGIVIGIETFQYAINYGTINDNMILFIGLAFILIIIFVFIIIIKYELYKKDIFSILYIFHSGISVALIFLARYRFMRDEYGMSSRYQIQLMLLPIGLAIVLLILIDSILKEKKFNHKYLLLTFSIISILFISYGRVLTTVDEMQKSRVRKMCYERARDTAYNIDEYVDSEDTDRLFKETFEYSKGTDLIRNAFKILKDNKLNIYK